MTPYYTYPLFVFDVSPQCVELIAIAETLITGSSDPLTIQPSCLELTTIRKKPEDELVSSQLLILIVS